jgi:predicted flap endonuclease-1-like 5' DNA nuclease
VLEKKLRRLGISTFQQLASLSREELERVAERLGLSVERIRREGWISAARDELRSQRQGAARA